MRKLVFGTLTAFAILGLSGAAPAQDSDKRWETVERAFEASGRNDCPEALKLAKPLLKPGAMNGLSDEQVAAPYHITAMCYARVGNMAEARRMALAGTALPGALDEFWHFRLGYDFYAKDYPAAVATMTAMTQGRGRALNRMPIRILYQLNRQLRETKADALHLQFLAIVTASSYDPDQPNASKDGFRKALAEKLLAKGDSTGAAALVAAMDSTSILVELSFDTRFRGIMPANFDPRATAERELDRTRALILRYPNALAPRIDAALTLRVLGRPKEALDMLEAVRADGKKLADYSDAAEYSNWWWDGVARTQEMLGNADAAFSAYKEGIALNEDGIGNVSQVINIAHSRNRFGQFAEALKALPASEAGFSVSPYGAMELRLARGCANAALGNTQAFAADLAYAREHSKDNREVLPGLLLCVGDMDGAAAAVIVNLEDVDYRARTLQSLSDYDPPLPGHPLHPFEKRIEALKQRADVKAAIDKAGGIRRIPLQRDEL
jgi:tetratricopeptide (TPR) repeat protein